MESITEELLDEAISNILFHVDNIVKELITQESKWLEKYLKLDK